MYFDYLTEFIRYIAIPQKRDSKSGIRQKGHF